MKRGDNSVGRSSNIGGRLAVLFVLSAVSLTFFSVLAFLNEPRAIASILGVVISAVAIGASIVTIRSIMKPVRDLLDRAHRITGGDLETVGPRTGPKDIALVHRALDEMSSNLMTLSLQAEALSEGRLDDEVLNHNVAGLLGASMHGSVARLRSTTARLAYEATHDALTELPNRNALVSYLDRSLSGSDDERRSLAAIMLDLDGFKQANDDLGHAVGDEVLIHVANRLQAKAEGEFVARLGGDEFMIVVAGPGHRRRAESIARRCLAAIAEPTAVSSGTVTLTASAGIAYAAGPAWLTSTEVLRRVDLAMYEAKSAAADVVLFDQELHDSLLETTRVQGEIKQALHNDDFSLALQPIVNPEDRTVNGYEALIRWSSPSLGDISPALFVPIAEQSDLVDRIDAWVMSKAGVILRDWKDDPDLRHLTLSVNISARHLSNPRLVPMVADTIKTNQLRADRLVLEVTESRLIPNLARAEHSLRGLRHLGVRLAIDDFGTGYASVAHLRRVKFDRIKIDRSFLAHLDDETDRSLAALLVSLGRDLELEVVAEGIETDEQLAWAIEAGCTHAQGYLFGRPAPQILDTSVRN